MLPVTAVPWNVASDCCPLDYAARDCCPLDYAARDLTPLTPPHLTKPPMPSTLFVPEEEGTTTQKCQFLPVDTA